MINHWIGIIIIIQNSLILILLGVLVHQHVKKSRKKASHDPELQMVTPCGGSYTTDEYLEKFEKEDLTIFGKADPLAPTFDTIREIVESGTYDGTTEDELPDGYGEFGWDLTNPIPTVNRRGARQYLSLLRTMADQCVTFKLQGSYKAENVDYPVDLYILYTNESEVGRIYISSFQGTNSRKALDGFYLDFAS